MKLVARTRALPPWIRYGVTSIALLVALAARLALEPQLAAFPFALFIPIVLLAALLFNQAAGIYAAIASACLSSVFFAPLGHFWVTNASDTTKIGAYTFVAAVSAVAVDNLHRAYTRIAQAERQKTLLLQELSHRVSNHFASLASLINLKAADVTDPMARSALDGVIEQIRVLARVHDRFRLVGDDIVIDSDAFLGGLCADLQQTLAAVKPVVIQWKIELVRLSPAQAVPLGLIVNELVTNAMKHAFPEGREGTVSVRLARDGQRNVLTVEDDGVGPQPPTKGKGLGHRLVPALTQHLGGEMTTEPRSPGTRVEVRFDLASQTAS